MMADQNANPLERAVAAACVAAVDSVIAVFTGELGRQGLLLDSVAIRHAVRAELEDHHETTEHIEVGR